MCLLGVKELIYISGIFFVNFYFMCIIVWGDDVDF